MEYKVEYMSMGMGAVLLTEAFNARAREGWTLVALAGNGYVVWTRNVPRGNVPNGPSSRGTSNVG